MNITAQTTVKGRDVPDDVVPGHALGRICNLDEAYRQFPKDLVDELTSQCLQADEVAYDAYLEFKDPSTSSSWQMFEQALEHGINKVEAPGPALQKLFADLDRRPAWVDENQLRRGAVAMWRAGALVPIVFAYSTVAAGFIEPSGSRPVLFSGRLMNKARLGQRLLESFRFIANAYTPGGMDRFEAGFKLTVRVRMIHAAVRYAVGRTAEWRWNEWGVPINNLDAMNTQAGQFSVQVIDSLAKAGIRLSKQERADIFALTRYVGYVIGVPEHLLHKNEADARQKNRLHTLLESPADDGCRMIVNGIVDYSCEESFGGYDVLPPLLARLMTVARRKKLARGLICFWQPQYVEQLHYKRDLWRFALPLVRPVLWLNDKVSRLTPHKDAQRAAAVLREFNHAIATAKGERSLADPEEVSSDVSINAHRIGAYTNGA